MCEAKNNIAPTLLARHDRRNGYRGRLIALVNRAIVILDDRGSGRSPDCGGKASRHAKLSRYDSLLGSVE